MFVELFVYLFGGEAREPVPWAGRVSTPFPHQESSGKAADSRWLLSKTGESSQYAYLALRNATSCAEHPTTLDETGQTAGTREFLLVTRPKGVEKARRALPFASGFFKMANELSPRAKLILFSNFAER